MARIGSLAAWEQRLAAQRRDEDRLARERRQREKDTERLRQQEHLAERQRAAEEQTAEVEERMKALGEVLTSVLPLRPLTFERLSGYLETGAGAGLGVGRPPEVRGMTGGTGQGTARRDRNPR